MKKTFRLQNLGCANCTAKMEKKISKIDGVYDVTINFMTTKMILEGDENKMPEIINKSEKIIKKLEPETIIKKA
ncbi:MAG TPA: cation transporter [Clostridiales bacterium]|nr:cation transporter [Clostridiales bacterium]